MMYPYDTEQFHVELPYLNRWIAPADHDPEA